MTIIAAGAVPPVAEPSLPDRRPDASRSIFEVPADLAVSVQKTSRMTSGTSASFAAGAMLALQEQTGLDGDAAADLQDREARKHGQDMLEALADLQKDLLGDGMPVRALYRLTALAQMARTAHDGALAHILGTIRLRAQLEILRLTLRVPEPKTST